MSACHSIGQAMNANHFIKCKNCGAEFRSFFAGAHLARGCSEACPSCGVQIATPLLFGDRNGNILQEASEIPMIREFGEGGCDGYVFMGHGILHFKITSASLVSVLASYIRNIGRALDLLDIFYQVKTENKQVVLSTVYISIMSAYECLTDDLLECLQFHDLAGSPKKGRPNLEQRRKELFQHLKFESNDHVKATAYLYAFRNCLTHNAAIVDIKFLNGISKIGPVPDILKHYQIGIPLILDAPTATSFADSVQQLAHELFTATQGILTQAGK